MAVCYNKLWKLLIDRKLKKKDLVEKAFENYYLSLYQFSYSSFLEVMLLENFDENYLSTVCDKIFKYIEEFKKLRNDCYEKILKDSNTSVTA